MSTSPFVVLTLDITVTWIEIVDLRFRPRVFVAMSPLVDRDAQVFCAGFQRLKNILIDSLIFTDLQ